MDFWFDLDRRSSRGLQAQLRDKISEAIIEGRIAPNTTMPASRNLARQLNVSRNTVVLAYSALVEDGYLISRERSGFFVNPDIVEGVSVDRKFHVPKLDPDFSPDWSKKLTMHVSQDRNIVKPANWRDFKYCFIYGQLDRSLFPVQRWRECWRDAVGVREINDWSQDLIDRDDSLLVDQIRKRILPRRGLWVDESQILVTVGAQNATYIALRLLLNRTKNFGIEDPGYPDARNIARLFTDKITPLPIDHHGMVVNERLKNCDVVFSTPSHQSPTTVTMSEQRRRDLLRTAQENDFIIIEDDYEAETYYDGKPLPALRATDEYNRVIYIGSLSKSLAPGLRLGFLVGPEPLISEARALRRLIMRHPPANNQRAAAYFLTRGHHEALLRALVKSNKKKRDILIKSLSQYLPDWTIAPNYGGTSLWLSGPKNIDTKSLAQACVQQDVIIEPGSIHYAPETRQTHTFRMGFSYIPEDKIDAGVQIIAQILNN